MIKHRIIYVSITIVLLALMVVGMAPKEKKDIRQYLGKAETEISFDVEQVMKRKGIQLVTDENNEIMEIQLLHRDYQVNGICVGDSIEKIYDIYPEDWIVKDANHIWIGMGDINHFGIVTEYIIFVLNDSDIIQEIRLGYTTEFTKVDLPESNKVADDLLQGTWLSKENRELVFNEGILSDNILDAIWDKQFYTVVEPNKMIIKRIKSSQSESVMMNFWVCEDTIYLFAVNDRGIPIEKSIETFIKQE